MGSRALSRPRGRERRLDRGRQAVQLTGGTNVDTHERNSSAGDIAWFLVLELRTLVELLTRGEHHWTQEPNPMSVDAIAAQYEAAADELEEALASAGDAKWEQSGNLYPLVA